MPWPLDPLSRRDPARRRGEPGPGRGPAGRGRGARRPVGPPGLGTRPPRGRPRGLVPAGRERPGRGLPGRRRGDRPAIERRGDGRHRPRGLELLGRPADRRRARVEVRRHRPAIRPGADRSRRSGPRGPPVEMLGSGDLTLGGRKFSGSAQRRLRRHVLIHASLLYDFPLDRIDRYTLMPPRRPDYREDRPHAEFVTNLPMRRERLLAALKAAWLPRRPSDGPGRDSRRRRSGRWSRQNFRKLGGSSDFDRIACRGESAAALDGIDDDLSSSPSGRGPRSYTGRKGIRSGFGTNPVSVMLDWIGLGPPVGPGLRSRSRRTSPKRHGPCSSARPQWGSCSHESLDGREPVESRADRGELSALERRPDLGQRDLAGVLRRLRARRQAGESTRPAARSKGARRRPPSPA